MYGLWNSQRPLYFGFLCSSVPGTIRLPLVVLSEPQLVPFDSGRPLYSIQKFFLFVTSLLNPSSFNDGSGRSKRGLSGS